MLFWIYNLLFPVAFALMLPGYLRRMVRRGNYRKHFGQRLGSYAPDVRARFSSDPTHTWVQAVSVGEMLVALKLIAALRERRPDLPLVLSTTTTTGFQLARERAPADVPVIYTPIDLRFAVRRAFNLLRPSAIIIVDGGLWPNQLLEACRRGVPVSLVNARLSPRSEKRFRRFQFLTWSLFKLLDQVAVPEAADVARWESLGVASDCLVNTGSIKFDDISKPGPPTDEPRAVLRRLGVPDGAPILLGGSTHPGEERLLANIFLHLRDTFPGLLLILAPRHVERAGEILASLAPDNLRIATRTQASTQLSSPPDVFLLDTTGELNAWYPLATLVFIGKSLTTIGGQNPAEAIAAGVPVLFGPHMENFGSLVAQLLAVRGVVQVKDAADLETRITELLRDPGERQRLAKRACEVLLTHQGAARRTAELLLP